MFIKQVFLWLVTLFVILSIISVRFGTSGIKQLGFPKTYYYASIMQAKTGSGVTHSFIINSFIFNLIICALFAVIIILTKNITVKKH